jgi:5-methylcytosine-specific restriction endonuclease McrA
MIKLTRMDIPIAIKARIEQKSARLRDSLEAGVDPPKTLLDAYREPELKAHLVAEAHGKCIYCESKITHVYFGDIEHLKPKSKFPIERLNPENLALACAMCNAR